MNSDARQCVSGLRLIQKETAAGLKTLLTELVGTSDGPDVPMLAPAMLLGESEIRQATQAMTPPAGLGVVHESQSFTKTSPMYPEGRPDIRIAQQSLPMSVVFDFEIGDAGTGLAQMQTRLRFVTRDVMAGIRGADYSRRFEAPGTIWASCAPIGMEAVTRYVALAHDTNPIHVDDAAARKVGLKGAVVPGMIFCGMVEYALLDAWPGCWLRTLKCRFMSSVGVGEPVRLSMVPRKTDETGGLGAARVFVVTRENTIAAIIDVQAAPLVS